MDKNAIIMLIIKDSINYVTYKKFKLKLTSYVYVLSYVFVGLCKYMPDY